MGTATHGHNVVVESRWLGLLDAAARLQTQEALSDEGLAGAYKDMLGTWIEKARQLVVNVKPEDDWTETEEGCDLPAPKKPKAAKGKRDHGHAKVSIPGGPCAHCGATTSPQWRRPADKDTTLCNACGIYYGRHGELPRGKSKVAQGQPQSLAIPSVAGDSCQSLSQPTPVSLPTLTLPTPQAQPEQAMPGSATGEHTAELPPNAVLVRPVRSRRPSYKLRESPASSESQSGSAAPPTAHSSRPALSPAYSDDSSGHAFVQQSAIAAQPIEVARCAASHPLKRARSSQLGLLPQPSQSHAPPHNALEAAEPAAPSDSVHTAMAHGGSVPARVAIPMASSALLFPYPAAAGASVAAAPVYGPANVAAPAPSVSFPAATAAVPGAVVLFLPVRTCKGPRRLVSTM